MFYLEGLEVVDEDIWQPQMVDKLQVDRNHGVAVAGVDVVHERVGDVQAGLLPHHVKVGTELNAVLLVVDGEHIHNVDANVNGVHCPGEGKIKLVVLTGQTKMLAGAKVLLTNNLFSASGSAGSISQAKELKQEDYSKISFFWHPNPK